MAYRVDRPKSRVVRGNITIKTRERLQKRCCNGIMAKERYDILDAILVRNRQNIWYGYKYVNIYLYYCVIKNRNIYKNIVYMTDRQEHVSIYDKNTRNSCRVINCNKDVKMNNNFDEYNASVQMYKVHKYVENNGFIIVPC